MENRIKKVALVYDAIYPYCKGGGEKRFYEIGKRLASKGIQVHLYGMKSWNGPDVIQKEGMYLHGICPNMPLYHKGGKRTIKQAIIFGVYCFKLIKEDFDVIDCCGFPYFSLFTCKLICILKGKKLTSTWHEVWGEKYWKNYLGNLWIFGYSVERLAAKLPDKIIAVSKLTAKRIKKELGYKGSIVVVPNGVDLKAIQILNPSSTKSDVIYAGRLMDFKNIDLLIKSVSLIKKQSPDIKCLIVGDGPEKAKLKALSRKLKLDANVKFTGFLAKHEDVYALMKSSKVFVLPSTREGFGMVVIETNACGLPVITVDHKDNAAKDLVTKGVNGYISDLNEDQLADKILHVLNSRKIMKPDKNIGQYDWLNITHRISQSLSLI